MLRTLGVAAVALHSGLSQRERLASLARFKGGAVPLLLSTDVGSRCVKRHMRLGDGVGSFPMQALRGGKEGWSVHGRGLDIPTVGVVINYDIPRAPRDYVHRVGRTARAGRGGRSVCLVCPNDVALVQAIEGRTRALWLPTHSHIHHTSADTYTLNACSHTYQNR